MNHQDFYNSRRSFLSTACAGFGATALNALLQQEARANTFQQRTHIDLANPLLVRAAHLPARAKNVIFLFQYGGPSQVDTLDYKPLLAELADKPVPDSLKAIKDKVGGVFNSSEDRIMVPQGEVFAARAKRFVAVGSAAAYGPACR